MDATCPNCGSGQRTTFYEALNSPTHVNFLSSSKDEALACPRGDIVLAVCHDCGLMSNTTFDPALLTYREGYENSLHYSSVFQQYAEKLADELIERFDLRGKTIVEIGCGRGDFLYMLCERGPNQGIGYDPSHSEPPDKPQIHDQVRFVKDLYSDRYADQSADFVCSRHTLEHVYRPADMLGALRQALDNRLGTPVFFEVPNGRYTLDNMFLWDIIYEHTSYFTHEALASAFNASGFDVNHTYTTFGDQYLCVEATPSASVKPVATDVAPLVAEAERFSSRYQSYVSDWNDRLSAYQGRKVVLWGGGSKAVTFLNRFAEQAAVEYVVDLNPRKHGMFIAGAGQEIVSPERLSTYAPDVVIIVNPLYEAEIRGDVAAMGLAPEFAVL